jgi:integrase
MASISNDPNGHKRILFINQVGQRKVIRLGKTSLGQAKKFKLHIEALVQWKKWPSLGLSDVTAGWLIDLDDDTRDKLAAVGLIDPPKRATLGPFVAEYIAKRAGLVKPGTLLVERQTEASLIGFFGADKRLRDVTEGDAVDFRNHLLTVGGATVKRCGDSLTEREPAPLAEATVRKRCSVAGKMFRYAMRHGIVRKNPFEAVPRANVATQRRAYVSEADAKAVLDQLPTTEWKLLFALSRWGGLRVGSEPRRLTWGDVDRERERFMVRSPKTERYAGGASRWIPIFPELAPLFAKQFAEAADGDTFVLPMLVGRSDASLRKTIERAITKAGRTVWPRLWHSMRASRQTDLENEFAPHVVCAWLGNSEAVAREHYLQVTDEHFARAAQKEAQTTSDEGEQRLSALPSEPEMSGVGNAGQSCSSVQIVREGFEQSREYSTFEDSEECAARGAAVGGDFGPVDPDLGVVVDAWPTLPESVRADILAMVRAARGAD